MSYDCNQYTEIKQQGMTERERQQELERLYSEQPAEGTKDEDEDSDGEDGEDRHTRLGGSYFAQSYGQTHPA